MPTVKDFGSYKIMLCAHLSAFGGGIEWQNGLDYGADTLKMMADEQRPVSGRDLVAFQSALNLSTAETAALLGLAERTVRAYRRAKWLPQSVAIAIRAILARGRPKKQTTKTAA
jgi:DNA-binding transcriptional regulator YiaG